MILAVGSTNRVKIEALEELAQDYEVIKSAKVLGYAVASGVSNQPLSLSETIQGAKNRAQAAFEQCLNCSYSFGMESGLLEAPGTNTGFLEAGVCCIYDGNRCYTGLSCGFELPPRILKLIMHETIELQAACYRSGITDNQTLGAAEGLVGLLTKGRIDRKKYTKQSIIMALSQLENTSWYE